MINRFNVMATLQAARGKVLGLSDEEAKSFGLNRAIFYAAAKRGFKHTPHQSVKVSLKNQELNKDEKEKIKQSEDMVEVGGEKAYAVDVKGKKYFVMGGKILQPSDFDIQIERNFHGKFKDAWNEAMDIVKKYGKDVLESQRQFYEEVYKIRRDTLAKKWSTY